ncbi:MAG: hypothetical protein ABIS30_05895 [Gallionella sp.]|jgi:uncharacterized protein (DUF697 family)
MASTRQNIHEIIRSTSIACEEIDLGSAQTSESNTAAIVSTQTAMIIAIAAEYALEIDTAAAENLLLTFSATVQGRQVLLSRQALAGWLPGINSDMNDSTAAALTEAIGWAANSHFEQAK